MTSKTAAERLRPESVRLIRAIGSIVLVLCLIGLAVGTSSRQIGRIRDAVSDIYQRVYPRTISKDFPALVVEIDQASLDKYGPWPWPRTRIASLTGKLFDYGALVVGFDIIFSEPDRFGGKHFVTLYPGLPDDVKSSLRELAKPDADLIDVLGGAQTHVVVARAGVKRLSDGSSRPLERLAVEAEFKGGIPKGLLAFPGALSNIEDIDEVARGHGLINAEPDADGVMRRIPLVSMVGGRLMPAFALELIRVGSVARIKQGGDEIVGAALPGNIPFERLEIDVADQFITLGLENDQLRAVSFGHFRVPVSADGTMRLHYSEPVAGRTVSALAFLEGKVARSEVERKLVIVGFTGIAIQDVVTTPLLSKASGSDVHAQVIEAIFYDGWLERPHWAPALEWTGTVLLGFLAVWLLPLLTPGRAVVISVVLAGAIVMLSILAFTQANWLIDIVLPAVGAGLPATVTMAGILLSTDHRRRELRDIVRVDRARAEEARQIQFAMLPAQEDLARLPAAVDVAPFLAPAQDVGGDFYDASMLDEQRLYFAIGDVAGKSISAALFMAVAKALSKSVVLRPHLDFQSMVNEISREVSRENPDEMFVTVLLGIMDLETGRTDLCNAGHENPIIIRNSGKVEAFAMDGGPPFCVLDGFEYPIETLTLAPGDTLVMVTDGVTEAWSPEEELFGRERLLSTLAGFKHQGSSETLVRRLVDAVRAHEGDREPVDDLTVMALAYRRKTD